MAMVKRELKIDMPCQPGHLHGAEMTESSSNRIGRTSRKLVSSVTIISFVLVFTWTLLTLLSSGRILASVRVARSINSNGKTSSESQDDITPCNLKDDTFCKSIQNAVTYYGLTDRTFIQTYVTNSGHLPFLHNALLSMRKSELFWNPLVLAIGTDVCSTIETFSGVGTVVCIPYLDRLLHQLQRDEPQSLEQIKAELLHKYNNTLSSSQSSSSLFDHIEQNVFGWGGGVEYKFLINAKLYALRDVIKCGPDAFITDTDIGFRQDPRPYFDIGGLEGDIIGQNDTNGEIYKVNMNSGFMYWKRTKSSLDLIEDIIKGESRWVEKYIEMLSGLCTRTNSDYTF